MRVTVAFVTPTASPFSHDSRLQPRFLTTAVGDATDAAAERAETVARLCASAATLEPKHFYDRLGSHLFEAITELDEYDPTRTEGAIFAAHAAEIAGACGTGMALVDLGAGNCAKAARLFPLLEPARYVAVDVSVGFLRDALHDLQREHPRLPITGLGLDFSRRLTIPAEAIDGERPVFFYPGSSIGNFEPDDALAFLRRIRAEAAGGGLLIGIDLVKDPARLLAAYDDALGVTAAFNRNALRVINRCIGSDFEPRDWRHVALWNAELSRIEMHLEATRDVAVGWPDGGRRFAAGERIHTESSCKWTVERFDALLREAGFGATRSWTDERGWFAVFWAPAG